MRRELNGYRDYSAEEISEVIARYRASGLGMVRFAREQGLPPGRLHYWFYQKQRTKPRGTFRGTAWAPRFQEVKMAALLPGVTSWAAEVSLPGGLAARFSGAATPAWIGSVVEALQRPC